jgi:hypothetical protein
VKFWELIADKLSKAGWSLGWSQPWILKVERSGLLTRIATMDSGSLRERMKGCLRLWNSNLRSSLAADCLYKRARFFKTRYR